MWNCCNWEDQGSSTVILRLFCFAFQPTFWITIRCISNRKPMSDYCDKQSDIYLFLLFILRYISIKIGNTLTHLFVEIPSTNEGWLWNRKWANELIVISRITFETRKNVYCISLDQINADAFYLLNALKHLSNDFYSLL